MRQHRPRASLEGRTCDGQAGLSGHPMEPPPVMPALVAGIHDFPSDGGGQDVDTRHRRGYASAFLTHDGGQGPPLPGHDGRGTSAGTAPSIGQSLSPCKRVRTRRRGGGGGESLWHPHSAPDGATFSHKGRRYSSGSARFPAASVGRPPNRLACSANKTSERAARRKSVWLANPQLSMRYHTAINAHETATFGGSMAKETNLTLVYDGGLAASGTLHFYEYSRASYAFARLVTTIEVFRRTDRVPQRVTTNNYVDILVKAPEKGSFPIDIIVPLAAEISKHSGALSNIPLSVIFKYVIQIVKGVLPSSEKATIEVAKLRLEEEKERTKQSKQETARMQELRKIVEAGQATTQQALNLLQDALKDDNFRRRKGIRRSNLEAAIANYEEQAALEEDIAEHKKSLEKIDNSKLIRLAAKVRPQIEEIGIPLRRSATVMKFKDRSGGADASFDRDSIAYINDREIDDTESEVEARIFAYDRDTGYGKCDISDLYLSRLPFFVPLDLRSRLRRKILDAIDQDAVLARIKFIRNRDKTVTSAILLDVPKRK